jgi:hypothetical protein
LVAAKELTGEEATMGIEQKISSALANPNIGSTGLTELITEVAEAADAAEKSAAAEKEKALDLVSSPDIDKAHETLIAAELTRDRLKTILPKLRNRLAEALATEQYARWQVDYQRVEKMRDQTAEKFAHQYPELLDNLVALFHEAEEVDKECARVNSSAPRGDHRRLDCVELTARGLNKFTHSQPSIAAAIQLPEWEQSSTLAWPPPQPSFAATYAASMKPSFDPRFSADWWKVLEQDNAERAAITERRIAEAEAEQVASRQRYEASLQQQEKERECRAHEARRRG